MQRILSKREKMILYIVVGLILFSIVFNFLLSPLINKISVLNKEVALAKSKLKKYTYLISQKEVIQNKGMTTSMPANLNITEKDSLVNALAELEIIAKNTGVRLKDIRPESQKIELKTEATIEGYSKFIYAIENSPSLLKIKKYQLTAQQNTQTLEGGFTISRFSSPE